MRKSLAAGMAALTFGAALAATAAPAEARDYGHGGYYGDGYSRRGNDAAGAAIVAGIAGLALGAALSSNSHSYGPSYGYGYSDRDYYDRGYYAPRVCESRRWVWDPYIQERVLIRRHYAC